MADASRVSFRWDSTRPVASPGGFDAFRREWQARLGDGLPLTTFSPATTDDFRVKGRVVKLRDVVLTDFHTALPLRTAPGPNGDEDWVQMFLVRRGAWIIDGSPDSGTHTVSGGQFLLRHGGRLANFETAPHTVAQNIILPAGALKPLLGGRTIKGPADGAEVRLLVAHANMVHSTVADLSPAGVQAVRGTLIELAKAVAMRRFDDVEPLLTPALAQAAKDFADRHLADPELSPTMLARELNVSVRTLQRAFAATGESVTAYIRHRRLEEARLALTAPSGLSISELAAHWHFADSSHFNRAFKKRYGQTPTEYARPTAVLPADAGSPRR
ncbi:helix-turn-helix domain-containing protein [Streptomyces sp. NPDC007983]|uniref:helix-turn-helix domain-containing protein n=1 Tax=Streptomyces sp. NPDC007983 TaxID=3364800 RepID=UPI0036EC8761